MRELPASGRAGRRRLRPVEAEWEWQAAAACRTAEPEVFFHQQGERGWRRRRRLELATEFCRGCPVAAACLDHALETPEEHGIWGGLDPDQRRQLTAGREAARRAAG